jgi:trk system potassium uptake protein
MKRIVVIGLSKFGNFLATELYNKGHEVVVIDKSEDRIEDIKDKVSQAIVADATDIKTLQAVGIKAAYLVVVCIGTNQGDSILITYNLAALEVHRIIAKASTEVHGRILEKVGATEVIFPERDLAITLARKIHNPNMLEYIPFIEDYTIMELSPMRSFIGKQLKEMDLINKYGIQILAIKDVLSDSVQIIPTGEYRVKDSDVLILLGPQKQLDLLQEKNP